MEKSACSLVRDQANAIQDKYNQVLLQIQGKKIICLNFIRFFIDVYYFNGKKCFKVIQMLNEH